MVYGFSGIRKAVLLVIYVWFSRVRVDSRPFETLGSVEEPSLEFALKVEIPETPARPQSEQVIYPALTH